MERRCAPEDLGGVSVAYVYAAAHMPGTRSLLLLLSSLLVACGDDGTTTIKCGTGTSGALSAGASISVTADSGADLRGAAIAAGAKTTVPSGDVPIACAADIVPEGYIALGPAVAFGAE